MHKKIYYQDEPISKFKNDKIGFQEEVRMLKEGLNGNSKVIGLIADYGSGKSSVINLLENNTKKLFWNFKYKFVRINLFDIEKSSGANLNENIEAQKKMVLQLASSKYKNGKFAYYTNRINENSKSIRVLLKNKFSWFLILLSFFLMVVSYLYNKEITDWLPNVDFIIKNKETIIDILKWSGVVGILVLLIVLLRNNVVYSLYNKDSKDEKRNVNEYDLIEIFNELLYKRTTVLIIEDLERDVELTDIAKFVNSIFSLYANNKKVKFIISLTPDKYKQLFPKETDKNSKVVDKELKPFDMIVNMPYISITDYSLILKDLLISKKKEFKKVAGIDIVNNYGPWLKLAQSKSNINIRIIKHRINDTLHLYLTLKKRFPNKKKEPSKDINIKTCIAVAYLRDEYKNLFEEFVKPQPNSKVKIKEFIDQYLSDSNRIFDDEKYKDLCDDIADLLDNDYIDYNCDKYIYNYSKLNSIFDVYEAKIYNSYIKDEPYNISESRVDHILSVNDKCLMNAFEDKKKFSKNVSENVFEIPIILNKILGKLTEEEKKAFYLKSLSINSAHIDTTIERLSLASLTDFYKDENINLYIKTVGDDLIEKAPDDFVLSRIKLIDTLISYSSFDYLYTDKFPLISQKEIEKINDVNIIIKRICYQKLTSENINIIIGAINNLNTQLDLMSIKKILSSVNTIIIDYIIKNLICIRNLSNEEKRELFADYGKYINLNDYSSIMSIVKNTNYINAEIEQTVINMLDSGTINISQYESFINIVPDVNDVTLKRLLDNNCFFKVPAFIVEKMKKYDAYGYIKYISINADKIIVIGPKKNKSIYNQIYNDKVFEKLSIADQDFLKYIDKYEIYKRSDLNRFLIMSYIDQNINLLNYAFDNLDNVSLSKYLLNIKIINSTEDELKALINSNIDKIKVISEESANNLKSKIKYSNLKRRITNIRKKA